MTVSLSTELANAALGAFVAAIGAFTGALTTTTASNAKALSAAGIAAGITGLTFFGNSLRNWLSQRSGDETQTPQTPPLGG